MRTKFGESRYHSQRTALTSRLWEPGYRERYYQSKFGIAVSDTDFIQQ